MEVLPLDESGEVRWLPGETEPKIRLTNMKFFPVTKTVGKGGGEARGAIDGTLEVTNFRLLFRELPPVQDCTHGEYQPAFQTHRINRPVINIPLGMIRKITHERKQKLDGNSRDYQFLLVTKEIADLRFEAQMVKTEKTEFIQNLSSYVFPADKTGVAASKRGEKNKKCCGGLFDADLSNFFPFEHFREWERGVHGATSRERGWKYWEDLDHEYDRILNANKSFNAFWKKIDQKNYEICETYPKFFYVPANVTEDTIHNVAAFRSKQRLPVLSWSHPSKGAVIVRSSQPAVGFTGKNSPADEGYIHDVGKVSHSEQMTIIDARPRAAAEGNRTRGGGYESDARYVNCSLKFGDIPNIHTMRGSFVHLKELLHPSINEATYLSDLENTHWLSHIKKVLSAAAVVAEKIECEVQSVLVHCSDGWDRTSQLVSLAMLMLDSHYRTMEGFATLIEKEWLSFGHKFAQRNGTGMPPPTDNNEEGPIFLQFLDCVWQIMRQYPFSFQFTESFLIAILEGFHSNQYGTFLFDCESERVQRDVQNKTRSIWTDLIFNTERRKMMTNHLYNPPAGNFILLPCCSVRSIKLWKTFYFRHNPLYRVRYDEQQKQRDIQFIMEALKQNSGQSPQGGSRACSSASKKTPSGSIDLGVGSSVETPSNSSALSFASASETVIP